jgi:HEAT repeat protein
VQQQINYLAPSVFALGKLGDRRASPLLRDLLHAEKSPARFQVLLALATLDRTANQDVLLVALHADDFSERRIAAEELAKSDDPSVLTEIEVQASREAFHELSLQLQRFADDMRARISQKAAKPKHWEKLDDRRHE